MVELQKIIQKIMDNTKKTQKEIDTLIEAKIMNLNGLISKEGAAHIIANELKIDLYEPTENQKIKDILPLTQNITLTTKVLKKYDAITFNTEKGQGQVQRIIIGDETGTAALVLWNDKIKIAETFKEGDILTLNPLAAKLNNKNLELHLGSDETITINPAGIKIEAKNNYDTPLRKRLNELAEGDQNIEIDATIISLNDLKFFGVNKEGKKPAEGEEPATYKAVLNIHVDDGLGSARTVLWNNQIKALLGIDDEKLLLLKENPDIFEKTKEDLLGKIVKIIGRVQNNEMFNKLELVANIIKPHQITKNTDKIDDEDDILIDLEDL